MTATKKEKLIKFSVSLTPKQIKFLDGLYNGIGSRSSKIRHFVESERIKANKKKK